MAQVREVEEQLDDEDRQLQFQIQQQKERLEARLAKGASGPFLCILDTMNFLPEI